jgi:transcriptional regulator with XRE-family HTH domain
MAHVGDRVRTLRAERQMTLQALAEKSGLSKGLLSKLENLPGSNPSLETLHKVAVALNVTLSDLLDSEKVMARRYLPEEVPPWVRSLCAQLKQEGREPDEDVLQALYVLQSRKGSTKRSDSDWIFSYNGLERVFGAPRT